jgi:hypothetical protein
MTDSKLLVSTTLGNSILDLESTVYTLVNDKTYLSKYSADLNVGDLVLFENEYIQKAIEEIEPYLIQSPRYKFAKDMLHEINSEGEYIPKLRTWTIRGLAQNNIIRSNEDLETKILKEENNDFSSKEHNLMKEEVFGIINPNYEEGSPETINRTAESVKTWLQGKVVAIRKKDWHLYKLLEEINPDFKEFNPDDHSREGYHFNSTLYNTVRQGIMRYLARVKGQQSEHGNNTSTYNLSLAPEIQLVMDEFVNEVSQEFSNARVLSLENLYKKHPKVKRAKTDPNLRKGVCSGRLDLSGMSKMNCTQLGMDIASLSSLGAGIFKYHMKTKHQELTNKLEKDLDQPEMETFIHWYMDKEKWQQSGEYQIVKKDRLNDFDVLIEILSTCSHDMHIGKMDYDLVIKHGTTQKLINTITRLKRSLPKLYIEFNENADNFIHLRDEIYTTTDPDKVMSLKNEYNRLLEITNKQKRGLENKYGFSIGNSYEIRSNKKEENYTDNIIQTLKKYDLLELKSFLMLDLNNKKLI